MNNWYRFLAGGAKPLYGCGTLGQAFQFAGRLSRTRDIMYSTSILTDAEAQELRLEDDADAFSLTLALASG
jgi:hypothetical protein